MNIQMKRNMELDLLDPVCPRLEKGGKDWKFHTFFQESYKSQPRGLSLE